MEIYYSRKNIFWSNNTNDYLEKNVFDSYIDDWTQSSNTKSVNWESHYTASIYCSENFNPTYFKIVKNNQTFYFFVSDVVFDSNNGKSLKLELDFYYTYVVNFIETLKTNNPLITFKRKHCSRVGTGNTIDIFDKQNFYNNIPDYLKQYSSYLLPTNKYKLPITTTGSFNLIDVVNDTNVSFNLIDFAVEEKFYYLKIKRPNKGITNANSKYLWSDAAQFIYVPIKFPYRGIDNAFDQINLIPSDYVVGMVRSYVSPPYFGYCAKLSQIYKADDAQNAFANIKGYGLIPKIELYAPSQGPFVYFTDITHHLKLFEGIDLQNYSVDNINNEPFLFLDPFVKYSINGGDFDFSPNSIIDKTTQITDITIGVKTILSTKILTSINFSQNTYYNNTYHSTLYFCAEEEIPYSSNVYTNYLNNNINSINTGIGLAKEQRDITNKVADVQGGIKSTWGAMSTIGGGLLAVASGGIFGGGLILKGTSDLFSGVSDSMLTRLQTNFDVKSKIENVKATVADIKNKPNTMLDTYGDGVSRTYVQNIELIKNELPNPYKKLVFLDFYFNGYIVNTPLNFNEYDNRISFNYFEIGDAFQFCCMYLNYPKTIMSNIAKKCENGIRLWKTNTFNYTGKLDNKEK